VATAVFEVIDTGDMLDDVVASRVPYIHSKGEVCLRL
jgi:hypothetical protein